MRPKLRFLNDELIIKIVAEARDVLEHLGVEVQNPKALDLLESGGARVDRDKKRAFIDGDLIAKALKTAPERVGLYDVNGELAVDLSGYNTHFTPGSAAIYVLDHDAGESRKPMSADYVRYAKLMQSMEFIESQATAMIPSDVHENISDSYRLYLSMLYCDKPVVTGTFTIDAFEVMKDLQLAVRGSKEALAERPLTMFSCCPTSPLKWSDVTSQNVIDCAEYGIPVEFISMPLTGFMAPVTLVGTLIQHAAETLSGIVISQLAKPGAPVVWGGSPAIFDIRYETTPMGAVGTMMIDCAYNEIGKHVHIPTQAYIGLSDAKHLDAQAGLESSMGATLATLAGINNVSGPGMLDFESCFSLEKLVVDNEICRSCKRMMRGIEPREDFPSLPHFEELLSEGHLLIADHTRKYLKDEVVFPGSVIDRANRARWKDEGSTTLMQRAHSEVERLVSEAGESSLPEDVRKELTRLMTEEAVKHGMEKLPDINDA